MPLPSQFSVTEKPGSISDSSGKILLAGPLPRLLERGRALRFTETDSLSGKPDRCDGATPRSEPLPPCGLQRIVVFIRLPFPFGFFMASARWQWIAVFLTKRIFVCSTTPHFSTHSSFMILMRVFFQETHISLFDLGASVRIFF